jgi:hypothetical protein
MDTRGVSLRLSHGGEVRIAPAQLPGLLGGIKWLFECRRSMGERAAAHRKAGLSASEASDRAMKDAVSESFGWVVRAPQTAQNVGRDFIHALPYILLWGAGILAIAVSLICLINWASS